MSKNIALIALLLPFSGYTSEKKEQRSIERINKEARVHIWNGLHDLMYLICTYQCLDLSKVPQENQEWFWAQMEELKSKMSELDKEAQELEQA
jgi:hypothetical protein